MNKDPILTMMKQFKPQVGLLANTLRKKKQTHKVKRIRLQKILVLNKLQLIVLHLMERQEGKSQTKLFKRNQRAWINQWQHHRKIIRINREVEIVVEWLLQIVIEFQIHSGLANNQCQAQFKCQMIKAITRDSIH